MSTDAVLLETSFSRKKLWERVKSRRGLMVILAIGMAQFRRSLWNNGSNFRTTSCREYRTTIYITFSAIQGREATSRPESDGCSHSWNHILLSINLDFLSRLHYI